MRLNIFRSGRRLAMAFGALWAIIWICFALFEQPSLEMAYAVSWLGEPPIKVDGCDWGDATRYVGVKVGNGEEVGITLCFKGQTTSTGHHLIRYPGCVPASGVSLSLCGTARWA
jgi:hypothetical protein